jgi:[ribosomal protein S18]-alanine N-acetyltransferase
MAVLQKILQFFGPLGAVAAGSSRPAAAATARQDELECVIPAPLTDYEIRPLTAKQLDEICRLNRRCFKQGENYNRHTLSYLLSEPRTLSYRATTTPAGEMTAFIFVTTAADGTGHITTIGVAPEHRRRGLAQRLLTHAENALRRRRISLVRLEVRVSNVAAQSLYRQLGYAVVQRLDGYYNNGEDGFLMVKSLV